MEKINFKKAGVLMLVFLVMEILSFLFFAHPWLNSSILLILSLLVVVISAYRLEYGFLVILAELFIGSMGHLFFINSVYGQLPLRIAIWLAFMGVFTVQLIAKKSYRQSLRNFQSFKFLAILGIFVVIALINGLLRGHAGNLIFSDFNSWLFFLLTLPAAIIYGDGDKAALGRLKTLFFAGALWMSLKTLIFLFIFTHDSAISAEVYTWLRRTLSGEMTPTKTSWPRIFIQGQIYSGMAFFLIFWMNQAEFKLKDIFKRGNFLYLFTAAVFLSALAISFSRSFWAGVLAALLFSFLLVWRFYSFKKMIAAGLWTLGAAAFSCLIIYAVSAWPYVHKAGNFGSSFIDRVSNSNEAAVASRWSLLPALMSEIKKEPFFGQGYGATVTYVTSDPRVLESSPSGVYTTYAFEWGYLDLWLKLGLLGLAAYLLLLYQLIKNGLKNGWTRQPEIFFGLTAGLIFLAVTNIFTPYLNHPLGIGIIVLSSCLIRPNKIY